MHMHAMRLSAHAEKVACIESFCGRIEVGHASESA